MHQKNSDAGPWRGACASTFARPTDGPPRESWDLDVGDGRSWIRAIQICAEQCPVRTLCVAARKELFPHSNPGGVIWAGVAYSDTGRVLDTDGLRRLAAAHRSKTDRSGSGQNRVAG